jgi:hypothetical protein
MAVTLAEKDASTVIMMKNLRERGGREREGRKKDRKRKREREKEKERKRERDKERDKERETKKETKRENERKRERDRQTDKKRETVSAGHQSVRFYPSQPHFPTHSSLSPADGLVARGVDCSVRNLIDAAEDRKCAVDHATLLVRVRHQH